MEVGYFREPGVVVEGGVEKCRNQRKWFRRTRTTRIYTLAIAWVLLGIMRGGAYGMRV